MSQLAKHSESRVIWTIGNTQIIDDEPDQGIIPTLKAAALGIAAITTGPISPVIAIALAGYAALKVFESFQLGGKDAQELGSSIYDDVNGAEVPSYQSQLPEREPVRITTQLGESSAIDVPARSDQPFALPVASPESKLFDWNLLNSAYDDFPHLLLLGKTGCGKSFLAERLGRFLNGCTLVITPKKKPRDFQGMQTIGVPYDFQTIAANITGLAELVKQREDQMNRTGNDNFLPINVVLDEVPTFVAGCKDMGLDVVKDLKFIIRAGRTSKIRLILLAQGQEVKTLGIEGEGSLRDNLTYVYLKGFAEPQAKELKLDISKYDRPCLIDGKVADISQLVSMSPAPTPQQVAEHKPQATAQDLERMYNAPSAEHEVEESGSELQDSIEIHLKNAFPNWNDRQVEIALKAIAHLKKNPDGLLPSELKTKVAKLKEAELKHTKALLVKLEESGFVQLSGERYLAIESSKDDDFNW